MKNKSMKQFIDSCRKLLELKSGWSENGFGVPFDKDGIEWLIEYMIQNKPNWIDYPVVTPNEEGFLYLTRSVGEHNEEIVFDWTISLKSKNASYLFFDNKCEQDMFECGFNLKDGNYDKEIWAMMKKEYDKINDTIEQSSRTLFD